MPAAGKVVIRQFLGYGHVSCKKYNHVHVRVAFRSGQPLKHMLVSSSLASPDYQSASERCTEGRRREWGRR